MQRRNFLRLVSSVAATMLLPNLACKTKSKLPNFLVIMADDVSPELYGCYGNVDARTPNIDKLAETGVLFNTAWATPICSPTRAMILTGRYPHRTGWYHNALKIPQGDVGIDFKKNHLTFSRVLKENGYATVVAGKWQLPGKADDPEGGFDEYCLWEPSEKNLPEGSKFDGLKEYELRLARYWHPSIVKNGKLLDTKLEDFGPDICTDFLIDFIKRNKDKPFLAYYPMILPHGTKTGRTTTPPSGKIGDHDNGTFQEGVDYTDVLVGRLVNTLDELGIRDETVIIFTSDNATPNKNVASEKGARVPFLVNSPRLLKVSGRSNELVSLADIFPMLIDFAQAKMPTDYPIDGISLVPYLTGKSQIHRDWLFSPLGTARIIRDKQWLLQAVDGVYGNPKTGRLYYCGDERNPEKYIEMTTSSDPDAIKAQKRLEKILTELPPPDQNDPRVKKIMTEYHTYVFRHRLP